MPSFNHYGPKVCPNPDCVHGESFEQRRLRRSPAFVERLGALGYRKVQYLFYCMNCGRIWDGRENSKGPFVVARMLPFRYDSAKSLVRKITQQPQS